MRIPSRRMPPAPEQTEVELGLMVCYLIHVLGLVSAVGCFWPWAFLFHALLATCTLITVVSNRAKKRRLRALLAERHGESICTFARSLDFRTIDTWIIRAVYEELQATCLMLPIRPSDHLVSDLTLDEDDLHDLVENMASRSGRRFEGINLNPMCHRVETVHDLILFLAHQPRITMV